LAVLPELGVVANPTTCGPGPLAVPRSLVLRRLRDRVA
jgi:hypothetical protein